MPDDAFHFIYKYAPRTTMLYCSLIGIGLCRKYASYLNFLLWNGNAIGCCHRYTRHHKIDLQFSSKRIFCCFCCCFSDKMKCLLACSCWLVRSQHTTLSSIVELKLEYGPKDELEYFFLCFENPLTKNSKRNIYCVSKRDDVTIWVAYYLNAFQFIIMKMFFVYLFTILFCTRSLCLSLSLSSEKKLKLNISFPHWLSFEWRIMNKK